MNDTLFEIDGIPVHRILHGVKVITVHSWITHKYPAYYEDMEPGHYERLTDKMNAWMAEFNGHLYERVKERFFVSEGASEAALLGKSVVLVDNLS